MRSHTQVANGNLAYFFATAFGGAWLAWLPIILGKEGLSVMPVSFPLSLAFVGTFTGPLLAAFVFSHRTERRDLIARMLRARTSLGNYASALLLAPAAVFAFTVAFAGEPIPPSRWGLYVAHLVPLLVIGSIAGPWGEEPGWRGFALPRLVVRFGPVRASAILGVVWALWHLPIALFVPNYRGGLPLGTFLPAFLGTICALSFFMTWLYFRSGRSVLMVIMAHAAWNASVGVQDKLTTVVDKRLPLLSAAVLLATIGWIVKHPAVPREECIADEAKPTEPTREAVRDSGDSPAIPVSTSSARAAHL